MTTETWYSTEVDSVEVEYSATTEDYCGLKEVEIDIHSIKVLGIEMPLKEVKLLVAKVKEEIREAM